MLKLLIVRSRETGKHIASYTTEYQQNTFPPFSETIITTEDIRAIVATLQNYLSSEASHAIISLTTEKEKCNGIPC